MAKRKKRRLHHLNIAEVSLVKTPANLETDFLFTKADESDGEVEFTVEALADLMVQAVAENRVSMTRYDLAKAIETVVSDLGIELEDEDELIEFGKAFFSRAAEADLFINDDELEISEAEVDRLLRAALQNG